MSSASPAFRFVHCADVHLDSPFRCAADDVRARLHDAGRATFRRLVDLCLAERVDALLVAGDLFDDERLSFGTEDFLAEQFGRLTQAGIHVVAVAGNHDHGGEEGRGAHVAWPDTRFHLIRGHAPEEVAITAADGRTVARVVGIGHADGADTENLAALLAAHGEASRREPRGAPEGRGTGSPPEGRAAGSAENKGGASVPLVALLHARVAEAAGAERHPQLAPCTVSDLAHPAFRYWALGHVHRRQQVCAEPVAHYPGTLLGHDFRETGAHGALLVTVPSSGEVNVEFRPLAGVRWETLAVPQLPDLRDLAALRAAITEDFLRLRAGNAPADLRWMLRIVLTGPSPAAPELQRDELVEELAEQLAADLGEHGVLSVEVLEGGVHRPVELSAHRGQPHVLGLSLEVIDALGTDDELLARLAPAALAGCDDRRDDVKRDYLRSLLHGIDSTAGEALLKETR